MHVVDTLVGISPFTFLVLALAIYRVTRLIVADSLLEPARNWLFGRFPYSGSFMDGGPEDKPKRAKRAAFQNTGRGTEARWFVETGTFLGNLLHCFWCIGFWVSVVGTVVYGLFPTAGLLLSLPFTFSAITGFIASKEG